MPVVGYFSKEIYETLKNVAVFHGNRRREVIHCAMDLQDS
jgi:hypothetical protein